MHRILQINKWMLLLPLALILSFLFLRHPLISAIVQWYVKDYCAQCLGGELHSQHIAWQPDAIMIDHPVIATTKPLHEGGHRLTADKFLIRYDLNLWERKVQLHIEADSPRLDLGSQASELEKTLLSREEQKGVVKVFGNLCIRNGLLALNSPAAGETQEEFIRIDCDAGSGSSAGGRLVARFEDHEYPDNQMTCILTQQENNTRIIDAHFHNIKLPKLAKLVHLFGTPLNPLEIDKGLAEGNMKITLKSGELPQMEGELLCKESQFKMKGVEGVVPEMRIAFADSTFENPETSQKILGKLDLPSEATLKLARPGEEGVNIRQLKGSIVLLDSQRMVLRFAGVCHHHDQDFALSLDGDALYPSQGLASFDLTMRLSPLQGQVIDMRMIGRALDRSLGVLQADIKNFRNEEFELFKLLLGEYGDFLDVVRVNSGTLNASIAASVHDRSFDDIIIDKIEARELQFEVKPWDLSVSVGEASGKMQFNLPMEQMLNTLNAEISISDGEVYLDAIDKEGWSFTGINTRLIVHEGHLQKSTVHAEFAGLKGLINMDWGASDEIMQMHFEGGTRHLGTLAPPVIQQGLEKKFWDDQLVVNAVVKKCPTCVALESIVDILDPNEGKKHSVRLGFNLEKTSDQLWNEWPPNPLTRAYWPRLGKEAMLSFLPGVSLPMVQLQSDWLAHELGLAGLILRKGWFSAVDLPLDKFIAPFVFWQDEFRLSGKGNFEGAFDLDGMSVRYTGSNVVLENNHLSLEVENLKAAVRNGGDNSAGVHYFDFNRGKSFGIVNFANGTYFEKNSGLLFNDIKALAILEGQKTHLTDLETYCNDVFFAGSIDVDYSYPEPGYFDVDVFMHTMNGKVPQVQDIFSHFRQSMLFLQLPLDGNVSLRQPGASLRFAFNPGDFHLEAKVLGSLSDGALACQSGDFLLYELALNFDYEHSAKSLNITDIQGSILMGKPEKLEEYAITGNYVRFADCVRNVAEFDLALADMPKEKPKEIMRIAGHTHSKSMKGQEDHIHFIFNRDLTHIAGLSPLAMDLVMRGSSYVENFHFETAFRLEQIMPHLKKIGRTGLILASHTLQEDFENLSPANGSFHLDLRYDRRGPQFIYTLKGTDVQAGRYDFKKCFLNGKKKDNTWIIEQLQLDNHSIAADISRDNNRWIFNFLGIRSGQSLLMGLEGEYDRIRGAFQGKVNLLEVDLGKIKEWPMLSALVQNYHPKGFMKATGHLNFEYTPTGPGWKVDALLNTSLSSLEIKGLHLQDIENASCHFVSDSRIVFRQLISALKSGHDNTIQGLISLEKGEYDFTRQELILDEFSFNAPAENLPWLAENLQQSFPDDITPGVAEIIRQSKKRGNLKGSFSLRRGPSENFLRLKLAEGEFWYLNKEHDLNNFVMERGGSGWKIVTQYRYQQHPFWLSIRSSSPSLSQGKMIFTDQKPNEEHHAHSNETLVIDWINVPKTGFGITKAEGGFSGLGIKLEQDTAIPASEKGIYLKGEVSVDVRQAANLLSPELRDALAGWEIGRGYLLSGKWVLNKGETRSKEDFIAFHGNLDGQDAEFKGYQFQKLLAKVDYTYNAIHARDLVIEDPAGLLLIEKVDLIKQMGGQWSSSIPRIELRDFRPSLLRLCGMPPNEQARPLLIKKLEIEGLKGTMGDSFSFTGMGRFDFSNKSRKTVNPLFAIPVEILTRLGLDLAVLNPVSGHIFFTIEGGRVHMTKFKDVYSEGKLSKFYLPNTSFDSYVDFDGNLHMQVRMKQYNLLFKLAELFTVTIKGNLQKPTYSLQKQPREEFYEAAADKKGNSY